MMHKTNSKRFSRILLTFICFTVLASVQGRPTVHGFRAFLTMACNIRCKHGSCKENQLSSINKITCQCTRGWTGHFCDISSGCELKCGNGKCVTKNGVECCKCPYGYEGTSCEIKRKVTPKTSTPIAHLTLPRSTAPNFSVLEENAKKQSSQCAGNFVCQNGGYCTRAFLGYKCQCAFPYTGVFCEELCDKKCMNGGKCFRQVHLDDKFDITRVTFRCNCPMGFQGESCEVNIFPGDYK